MKSVAASIVLAVTALTASAADDDFVRGAGAMIRGLDKVSGEVLDVNVPKGQRIKLGRLEVEVQECRYPNGNPAGEAFAYLVIDQASDHKNLFSGWMLASSPGLNPLDNARYDVWVLRCMT